MEDYGQITVTIPGQGIIIEGLVTGDKIEIRQGTNTIRFPAVGEGLQQVFDGIDAIHAALMKATKTKTHYEKARAVAAQAQLNGGKNENKSNA